MRILLVEDDLVISKNIVILLKRESYAVDTANSIEQAREHIESETYDCIILDRRLPDGDGVALIPTIRTEHPTTLTILLTARAQTSDVVAGLNAGADDYIAKPFVPATLLARLRALLRRARRVPVTPIIAIADLIIDTNTHHVTRAGRTIELSPREYAILDYLARHPCQAIDRMTILTHAWDERVDLFSNTVDVHIRYLRRKIDEGQQLPLIHTVRGKGYMLCDRAV